MEHTGVHTFRFRHPQQNLNAGHTQRRTPEAEFADQFASAYREKFLQVHPGTRRSRTLFVREVPVQGNGIADLVVLNWDHDPVPPANSAFDLKQASPTVRAFEVKLSNWRGGVMQAHRYAYFSHAAILVIPKRVLKTVETHLDLFRTLRVGLWGFDPDSEAIRNVYTPRPRRQRIAKYGERAIAVAIRAASP